MLNEGYFYVGNSPPAKFKNLNNQTYLDFHSSIDYKKRTKLYISHVEFLENLYFMRQEQSSG